MNACPDSAPAHWIESAWIWNGRRLSVFGAVQIACIERVVEKIAWAALQHRTHSGQRREPYAAIFAAALMMTVLVIGFTVLGTLIGGEFGIALPQEPFPWRNLAWQTLLIFTSTAALVALQSWIALRFANFVVPLVLGISGPLVAMAVMMTRTQQADWFPWVLPYKALIEPAPVPYAVAGAVGGLFIITITIVDLSKREVR